MATELETALDYYVRDSNNVSDDRKELVREKMLTSCWIPYEEQKPSSDTRILAKYREGTVYVEWFYGRQGTGILEITHWKPLIK
jgi:hypothetical protein